MTGTNCDSLRTSSKTPDEKVVGVSRESARDDVPVVDEWIVWGISAFAVALTFRLPFLLNVCGFYEMPFPAVFGSTPAMEEQIPSFAGNLETHEGLSREDWPETLAAMDEDFKLHVNYDPLRGSWERELALGKQPFENLRIRGFTTQRDPTYVTALVGACARI